MNYAKSDSFGATPADSDVYLSKVPEITFGFWIIKILATTLGETGGDSSRCR